MSSPETNDLAAVVEALRSHDRFLVTTHENPDGDALGSLLAARLGLEQLGKDVVMTLYGDAPLPGEYAFMALEGLHRDWPENADTRVLLAVDCANATRIADQSILERAPLVIDLDHHHDNTRFGDLNLIVPEASSTGEVMRDLFRELGVQLTPEIAEALYIALVTDTGRFQYTNTTPKALRLAAELVVLIREPPRRDGEGPTRRVSLRSSVDELDVSAIARRSGGGGHRQAAGFSSDASIEEITEFVRREFAAAGRSAA